MVRNKYISKQNCRCSYWYMELIWLKHINIWVVPLNFNKNSVILQDLKITFEHPSSMSMKEAGKSFSYFPMKFSDEATEVNEKSIMIKREAQGPQVGLGSYSQEVELWPHQKPFLIQRAENFALLILIQKCLKITITSECAPITFIFLKKEN